MSSLEQCVKTLDRRQILVAGAIGALLQGTRSWAAAPASATFRIGALNPITGGGANFGSGMQQAILISAAEVNAAGGAAGRKLEVFPEDDQTSPTAAVLAAKKLLEVNKVQAILGTWASGVSLAVLPMTNAADAILMHTSGAVALADPKVNARKMAFRYQGSSKHLSKAFATAARKEGLTRPAVMAQNNPALAPHAEGFRKVWTADGGKLTDFVLYEPNRPSYRSELQQVLRSRPDGIILSAYVPDASAIIREWAQLGTPMKWIIPGFGANVDFIKAVTPEVAEGIVVVESVVNDKSGAYARYARQYALAMKQAPESNVYAAMCYDMVQVLALAIEAAGPGADIQAIVAKIHAVTTGDGQPVDGFVAGKKLLDQKKAVNYVGASSNIDFDAENDVDPTFAAFVIRAGKWSAAYAI
jgi:branched-chain amino acid transport system substrate-binding protein